MHKHERHHKYRSLGVVIGLLVGATCIAIALFGLIDFYLSTHEGDVVPPKKIVTVNSDNPSEKDPGEVSKEYRVPANQPRAIQIPSLDVHAYVQSVGVGDDDAMTVPTNIYFTGWYVNSPAPGEEGVSIINGHVGGRYLPGIFKRLNELAAGDELRIQMGDNTWRSFRVDSVTAYKVNKSAEPLYADDPSIERELHLITCGGNFDDATQTYDKRTIVSARYVE